ncbi:hypothetical protein TNCV_1074831 [Trichonephila clavipes]|uniref:Uncharacterized protein n=1 Tax=Trichonephila clavipes TaxID=2585209 RepID=A0A8X6T3F0_TRICX|nr:hypothetical protein TNCV_1074831 [Trichonephila clavipes]
MMESGKSARPGSGRLRWTSHRKDHHIVRNARVQVAPSLGTLCLLEPYEGTWLKGISEITASITCTAVDTYPSMPPFGALLSTRKLDCRGMEPIRLYRRIQIQSQK